MSGEKPCLVRQDLQYLTIEYKLLPIPLSLPSAHTYKCNSCVSPVLKKQNYPNGFTVDLMIGNIVDAFKESKACFATIFAFTEQTSLCYSW